MKLKMLFSSLLLLGSANAADWDNYPIPATPADGYEWQIMSLSDDFNYNAPANGKNDEFYSRWQEGFINQWTGPGLTEWNPEYSKVEDGYLQITTGKNTDNDNIFAGSIVSKESLTYPIYMEVRAKISDMVTASNFWLLSKDSTQEIDVLEAYGSGRSDQTWFAERIHLSHHVFIREPFQDYQPTTADTWYARDGIKWKDAFHTVGVYWRDPWHLEYYIDGEFIKSSSGKDIIDPLDYTEGTGLSKPMQSIINTESHTWRSDEGLIPTDEELDDPEKNLYLVDWVRFYQAVPKNQATDESAWQDGDTITKEFSDFIETGKDGTAFTSDTVEGFGVADTDINFNTVGDWATYSIDIAEAGFYRIELVIGSPEATGIGAEVHINSELFSTVSFTGTGDWGVFETFAIDKPLEITTSGNHTVRIKSQGAADWQWNGDKINLVKLTPIGDNPAGSSDSTDDSNTETDSNAESDSSTDDQGSTSDEQEVSDDNSENNTNNSSENTNENSAESETGDSADETSESNESSGGSTSLFWVTLLSVLMFIRRQQ